MAATQTTQKGFGLLGDFENWIAQKQDDVDRLKNQAVGAGRDAWTQATQASQNLFAPKPDNPPTTNPRAGSSQPQLVAPAQPNANPVPNAWAPVLDPAMDITRNIGNVVGVGRGVVHSGEGLLGTAAFLARLANPWDKQNSPPGASAYEQLTGAANQAADYVKNGLRDPGSVWNDVKDAGRRLLVDIDPNASPPASTLAGEFQRNFNIGQNQGELGYNLSSLLFGGALLKGATELGYAPEAAGASKFLAQGFSQAQADYLASPYKGIGHHFFPRRGVELPDGSRLFLRKIISDSPFNVLKPPGINIGDFYGLHYDVDPHVRGFKIPAANGGGVWPNENVPLQKYGLLGRLWYGSPPPLKTAVGLTSLGASISNSVGSNLDESQ
jgi:hypothetical protein